MILFVWSPNMPSIELRRFHDWLCVKQMLYVSHKRGSVNPSKEEYWETLPGFQQNFDKSNWWSKRIWTKAMKTIPLIKTCSVPKASFFSQAYTRISLQFECSLSRKAEDAFHLKNYARKCVERRSGNSWKKHIKLKINCIWKILLFSLQLLKNAKHHWT